MEDIKGKSTETFGASKSTLNEDGIYVSQSLSTMEKTKFIKKDSSYNDNGTTSNDIGEKDIVEVKRVKTGLSRTSTKTSLPPAERRTSYQVRAMTRKTLSYQRRQIKTNICCVAACPVFMVVIAFLLSLLVEYFLNDLIKPQKYEYCTNEFNGHYVLPGSNNEYKKDEPDVQICHYASSGGLGYSFSSCSYWFGTGDHFASSPYDTVPDNPQDNIQRDTLFIPPLDKQGNYPLIINKIKDVANALNAIDNLNEILQGIANEKNKRNENVNENENEYEYEYRNRKSKRDDDLSSKIDNINIDDFSNLSEANDIKHILDSITRPWGIMAINKNNGREKDIIGERPEGLANMTLEQVNSDNPDQSNGSLLGYTSTRYFLNVDELMNSVKNNPSQPAITFEKVPFFEIMEVENDEEVDDILVKRMELINKMLSNTTFDSYSEEEKKQIHLEDYANPDEVIEKSVDMMPYGVVHMKSMDEEKLTYDTVIAVGENNRLSSLYSCEACSVTPYMSYPGKGLRLIYFLTELTNASIRKATNGTSTITQGFRSFPQKHKSDLPIDIAGLIGYALYPWGVSFLIPIFVICLVKEKEERYLVMMNMNGIKSSTYYISVYITNLILSIISMIFFYVSGYLVGLFLFTRTSKVILCLEFFIWSNIQVIFSFVLSLFFKRNSTALIASFLVVLMSIVLSLSLINIFNKSAAYFIWPLFGFYFILSTLSSSAILKDNPAYQMHNFRPGNSVFNATMILIADFIILCLLALYLSAVLPQEYGTHQPWHLNIICRIKKLFRRKKGLEEVPVENDDNSRSSLNLMQNPFYSEEEAEEAKALEDDDVRAERKRVLTNHYEHGSPLVVKNFRKEYPPRNSGEHPHVAVRSVTFAVEEGSVFGLLGPNGAGKTTLIHSLIGVYSPTSGYARLAGYNIKTDMDQVYKRIGICPQHDILWNDLTVEEHLLFYARLKGIPKNQEKAAVQDSLASVGLESFKTNLVQGLSGGERRRLSIAIALVGDPKLVFLDEPTTGLDPDVRRLIWSILDEISHQRTIILTTHSMEEAEVLCHRIGIMSHGTLRCCATLLRLKELYGSGFRLSYTNHRENYRELKEFILSILPQDYKIKRDLATNSIYEFIPPQGLISQLFTIIEENKERYGIIDWGISQSSLEEVFLSIISDEDADAS